MMGIFKKKADDFPTPYTCMAALKQGGTETKLSALLMGFGNIVHKQAVKGMLFMVIEIAYIAYMITAGLRCLSMLPTLGSVK